MPVLTTTADGAGLVPRNDVTLTGKFGPGPFNWSVLQVKAGSLSVGGTNKPFGMSEPRGAEFFKDASSLAGRYVQLTNVTFTLAKFDVNGVAKVKSPEGAEVSILVGKPVAGRDVPAGPLNIFGVPVRRDGAWQLLAARLLSTNVKVIQNLAMKHTCFTCHNPDTKLIGPAYRDVAAKYRNDPDAAAKLIAQMENGGGGKWGPVPMVPFKGKVPPADMQLLAGWILGYRWDALLAE
ncbi:MAG TPA: c-type cytochrome [Verrucomicrobiae bacterium]|nr:c-type cytochrome [Verrucomicrobiae bacterium]